MGAKENEIIKTRLGSLDPATERLTRVNSGMGWVGEIVARTRTTITIKNPRPFHGTPEGTPDMCGWTTVTITPEMVGQKIAVFTAEEVKATGRLSEAQRRFRILANRMGVIYRVLHG